MIKLTYLYRKKWLNCDMHTEKKQNNIKIPHKYYVQLSRHSFAGSENVKWPNGIIQ